LERGENSPFKIKNKGGAKWHRINCSSGNNREGSLLGKDRRQLDIDEKGILSIPEGTAPNASL